MGWRQASIQSVLSALWHLAFLLIDWMLIVTAPSSSPFLSEAQGTSVTQAWDKGVSRLGRGGRERQQVGTPSERGMDKTDLKHCGGGSPGPDRSDRKHRGH